MKALDKEQIAVVRAGWVKLRPQAARLIDVLYEELFSAEPQLRILFEGPMDEQHLKLVGMLEHLLALLDDPVALQLELQQLGARHANYGVRPYHYEAIEAAFDRTLQRLLGDALTPVLRSAWSAFVHLLTTVMQEK